MSFFDKKEDVLEIVLTPHGRSLLSKGKLMPAYYSFLDDDILYDVTAVGDTESNYQVKERILNTSLSLKPQTNMSDLMVKLTENEPDLTNDVVKKNIYTLGTSNNLEEFTPAWNVKMLKNELLSSSATLQIGNKPVNIPQLDIEIEYNISVSNINKIKQGRGIRQSAELPMSRIYDDGTFLKIDEEQILAQILEENGFGHADSIEVEVYKYDDAEQEKLIPLKFTKKKQTIQNDLFTPEKELDNVASVDDITPATVEYYFDVRVDKEIPEEIDEGVVADVYTSRVTDVEDCDT
tara:strand:+ start:1339 stop:2217 length:879 start_codon:yes stop_codon:yes gene_type:complete